MAELLIDVVSRLEKQIKWPSCRDFRTGCIKSEIIKRTLEAYLADLDHQGLSIDHRESEKP